MWQNFAFLPLCCCMCTFLRCCLQPTGSIWCNAALSSNSQQRAMQFVDPDDLQINSDNSMIIQKIFALELSRARGKITKICVTKPFQAVSDDRDRWTLGYVHYFLEVCEQSCNFLGHNSDFLNEIKAYTWHLGHLPGYAEFRTEKTYSF